MAVRALHLFEVIFGTISLLYLELFGAKFRSKTILNVNLSGVYVAITYRVYDFENFDENFVQGTISPLLKSHIPPDGSVSLFKYLSTELKRI